MAGAPYSFHLRRAACNTFPRPQQLRYQQVSSSHSLVTTGMTMGLRFVVLNR